MEHIARCIARLKLPSDTAVAVAVSGGSDSVALTFLAKQLFRRVLGITVDHRLRQESSLEAVKTASIVRKIGAEHHILTLDWPARPPLGKLQFEARLKRYEALFRVCREKGIAFLMTAHHKDDQLATFLTRLSMGSSIDGLGGMREITSWSEYPDVQLLRPLLHCSKKSLRDICIENNLEWVEDPSNALDIFKRNRINKALQDHPELIKGLEGLVETCTHARNILQQKVYHALVNPGNLVKIEPQSGCVKVCWDQFRKLDVPVAKRVLLSLLHYVTGETSSPCYTTLSKAHRMFSGDPTCATNMSLGLCILVPCVDHFIIGRSKPPYSTMQLVPIRPGETLLWDKRFHITMRPLLPSAPVMEEFYVRHMVTTDWELAKKGIRKVRAAQLPHENIRGGLPVILNKEGKVVLIPHFKVIERSAGVVCDVKFAPQKSLDFCVLGSHEMDQAI